MSEEILTLAEINARYPDEWVLVVDPEVDEHLNVLRGQVAFHSRDRDEVDRKALQLRPKSSAFIFTGRTPEGMVFAL
jgi:hypothetical protein